ncbi:MAG: PAS domain-containing protein [Candidatus Desulfaltia sp.]|nr:PAS domain-containing protein [Candidatus Desulfaltia sp.]
MLDINNAGVELFGFESKEEALKANVQDLYENPEVRKEYIRLIVKHGFTKGYPADLIKKDGRIFSALITSVVRKDVNGNLIGSQGTLHDITNKKRRKRHCGRAKQSSVII